MIVRYNKRRVWIGPLFRQKIYLEYLEGVCLAVQDIYVPEMIRPYSAVKSHILDAALLLGAKDVKSGYLRTLPPVVAKRRCMEIFDS